MFYNVIKCIVRFVFLFVYRFEYINRDNLPKDGGVILACNHTSNMDVLALGFASKRPLNFMAKNTLFNNKLFGWIISHLGAFPVDRARGDMKAIKTALERLQQKKVLIIFPEGTRVRNGKRIKAKQGVAMIALHAKVPVVPVRIKSNYKFMSKVSVEFGKPIYLDELCGEKPDTEKQKELSEYIMDKVYEM